MLTDVKYLKYNGNEYLIDNFYDILFEWRQNKVIDVLEGYCELKGNAVNEEMRCFFANEFPSSDEEYFGEEGVAFYFDSSAVLTDCIIVLTYMEFFAVVKDRYEAYMKNNRNEIKKLLVLLKRGLGLDIQ